MSEELELKLQYDSMKIILEYNKHYEKDGHIFEIRYENSDWSKEYDYFGIETAKQIIEFLQKHIEVSND